MARQTVYLVTGCGRRTGLGLHLCTHILNEGDTFVVATSRRLGPDLEAFAAEHPGRVLALALETTDEGSVQAAAAAVGQRLGRVDVLVNNAGVIEGTHPALDSSKEELVATFTTNVVGTFLVTRAFLPLLKRGERKVVVNISSSMGSVTGVSAAAQGEKEDVHAGRRLAYRISKTALNMETAVLANALKGDGICICSLSPGWVSTELGQGSRELMGADPPYDAETSTRKQLAVIRGLTLADSGGFRTLEGKTEAF